MPFQVGAVGWLRWLQVETCNPFNPYEVGASVHLPSHLCMLLASTFPAQAEGVAFGLRRHGRILIADEMGVGKTVQAIALASCYQVRAERVGFRKSALLVSTRDGL